MLYSEVVSVQYIGFTPYLFIEDELYIPYNFSLGSEFKLGQFFSLIPYFGFGGVLNESEADTTGYFGLMTNFFLGDYFSIMLNLRGDSDDGTAFWVRDLDTTCRKLLLRIPTVHKTHRILFVHDLSHGRCGYHSQSQPR